MALVLLALATATAPATTRADAGQAPAAAGSNATAVQQQGVPGERGARAESPAADQDWDPFLPPAEDADASRLDRTFLIELALAVALGIFGAELVLRANGRWSDEAPPQEPAPSPVASPRLPESDGQGRGPAPPAADIAKVARSPLRRPGLVRRAAPQKTLTLKVYRSGGPGHDLEVHPLREAPAQPRVAPPAPGVDQSVSQPALQIEPAPLIEPTPRIEPKPRDAERAWPSISPRTRRLILGGTLLLGAAIRVWEINAVGLNSDEAVYAGQGASIAGNGDLAPYFPTFRAHPLLFQSILSFGFDLGHPEVFGRVLAAAVGVATIYVTYLLGRLLYGSRAGLIAAAIMALMPYHVVVTRQILLDGPRTLMSTLTLYLLARYALTERSAWFHAAAAALGLTFLCKEDSAVMLGAIYAFLALTPGLRTRLRDFLVAGALFTLIVAALPVALDLAGRTGTGGHFLAWQLFRRPNHSFLFYPTVVPVAIGLGVIAAAAAGLWLLRRDGSWRETLLLAWIVVPVAFYQLFPVKGFQYLLPIAPALAALAARFFSHWDARTLPPRYAVPFVRRRWARRAASSLSFLWSRRTVPIALGLVLLSLAVPSWQRVQQSQASTFLAGSGGLPGGREAGRWIARHVPEHAQMMSIGPSMANVLQYYGHRKVYGLSVSPNPLHRNPVYEAMRNPDRLIRDNELQYIVWDAFSAQRSPFFTRKLIRYVERYQGHVVYSGTAALRSPDGRPVRKPLIVIYEVRP